MNNEYTDTLSHEELHPQKERNVCSNKFAQLIKSPLKKGRKAEK